MSRQTIDFGIDLGTTNSSIAVFNGTGATVFKNNEGQEYTPSAVWMDPKNRLYVGRRAKERLEDDSENAFSEFKLLMGTDNSYRFTRNGRQMRPEELSAEVLKSLRGDVQQRTGEEVRGAVISVPAAFNLPHTDATNKAARLAGLEVNHLVQEPVAAAIAHGFQSTSDKVYWMVYDFGGGTFDVAIIQLRDEQIQIVNHQGDNQLGGKLIDWEIVDQLFVPALTREYRLNDFKRGTPKWKAAFAKLKLHAEEAKIQLSRDDSTEVVIDMLCQDDRGMWVRFEHELKRSDIEPLIEPKVERSVNLCLKTLEEKRLSPGNIEKLILVGGPTLTPIVRQMLTQKLKIKLDFSKDPLTVNAQGAAIFAGGIPIPRIVGGQPQAQAGQYTIELEYKPIGNDPEPLIGGKVTASDSSSLTGFTIEFVESKTQWRSGRITLMDGKFVTTVRASERRNEFVIELRDGAGNIRITIPDRFTYTKGKEWGGQPLINSIGIALSNGEMQIFLQRGTPLPARRRDYHLATTKSLNKGATGTLLRIPVVEGEHTRRADRNRFIGALEIDSDKVKRDVPLGSEVEVTIEVDDSRQVTTKAFIPVLDEEFQDVLKYEGNPPDRQKLADEFKSEKERLDTVRQQAQQAGIARTNKTLARIQEEGMLHDIEVALAAAQTDPEAAIKCQKRLLDLAIAIDEVEDVIKWPAMVAEAEKNIKNTGDVVTKLGSPSDRSDFDMMERETRAAIAAQDADLLHQKVEQLNGLEWRIRLEHDEQWIGLLLGLETEKGTMRDKAQAERLLAQGRRAMENNDINGVKAAVRGLFGLLPRPAPPGIGGDTASDVNRT